MYLSQGDALIIVDCQNDFVTGSLACEGAFSIIPVINELYNKFQSQGNPVYASLDWHPENHSSFVTQGGPWPVHCVQNTWGAALVNELYVPNATRIFKATNPDEDAYSAYQGTTGAGVFIGTALAATNVKRVFITGIATEYCVKATALDAVRQGFDTIVVLDAIAGVNPETSLEYMDSLKDLWTQNVRARTNKWIRTSC